MRLPQSNVFWSGLEAGTSAFLSFLSAFIVARIVGPAEVGVGAAVVATHVLLWVVVNALFADALVQRLTVDEEAASSAIWASTLVGVVAALVQAGAGIPVALAIGDGRIMAMSLALALPLPLVGAAGAMQGMLTRRRDYRALAGRAVIGQGAGTLIGISLALSGAGAWAIVAQQLGTSALGALSLLLRAPIRPSLVLRWQPVRELLPCRVAAGAEHARPAQPLSAVRAADRWHGGCRGARPGAHGVPPRRDDQGHRLNRILAALAAGNVGAAAQPAGAARGDQPLPRPHQPRAVSAVRRHAGGDSIPSCVCCWARHGRHRPTRRRC